MKWEEHQNKTLPDEICTHRQKTGIECPKCGKMIWKRTDVVLTSYPPKYQYECECGWIGYAYT